MEQHIKVHREESIDIRNAPCPSTVLKGKEEEQKIVAQLLICKKSEGAEIQF